MTVLAAVLVLAAGVQDASSLRTHAEELARTGRTAEAIALFKQVVERDPADTDARLWIARLDLRMGRTDAAEAEFRSVLREHPDDVDARVGLGAALTRRGACAEALAILLPAEPTAGPNADLFSAIGRAYRGAGDDPRALEYFRRASAIAPDDPDVADGLEAVIRAYGHWVAVEGFVERGSGDATAGRFVASIRVRPRLHLEARARAQERSGSSDALAGGGVEWRIARATTLTVRALGGPDNTSLPTSDLSAQLIDYRGSIEIGAALRRLSFAGVDVISVSPGLAWDQGGRWRIDGRYTFSRSHFHATGESTGDHSILLRDAWRRWRRAWITTSYAYGIESFEELTADRVASMGASTVAAGLRVGAPSHTVVTTTWEHQWRSNAVTVDRFVASITQFFP